MTVAAPRGARRIDRLRAFGRRRRTPITIAGSLLTAGALVVALAGRRHEFATALSGAALWVLALTTLMQVVALVARSEAWHLTIEAAGGRVARRVLYRASSMQVVGGVINGHLGVAARIAALRRSSPEVSPQVPTLIASEFPILVIEGTLAALTSFTLIGPLGLPWWLPVAIVAGATAISAGLRHLALGKGRELWRGLAVLRSANGGSRVFGFVFIAVLAQMARTWMLLRAVGVPASLWDAIAVLIAVVTLSQLPTGPSVGAASAVLILGREGVAKAAAAGVLLTVTGTIGGLFFLAWAGADGLLSRRSLRRGQFHFDPSTYDELMAREVPAYARLQDEVVAACGSRANGQVLDVLELGTGTGETACRVLAAHPGARLVGIDASPAMLAAARERLPAADLRVARMEDALPAGPFDLVVSALAVHHLDADGKSGLFGRVAGVLRPGGCFVLGDVVVPEDPADACTPLEPGYDMPSSVAEQLGWLEQAGFAATPVWRDRDLAVILATRR